MNTDISSALSIIFYVAAIFFLWRSCHKPNSKITLIANSLIILGWVLQGTAMHSLIELENGQNLSITNLFGTVAWLMILLLVITNLRSQVHLMIMFMLGFAASSQVLATWHPSSSLLMESGQTAAVAHVLSSLLAYSFLALAALQASMVWWLDRKLHSNIGSPSPILPPLLAMEKLLFRLILLGFIVLSISIGIALIYLYDIIWLQSTHKIVLSIAAWMMFSLLLLGHWRLGWRGQQAAKWTLTGFLMLALASFGTWIIYMLRAAG